MGQRLSFKAYRARCRALMDDMLVRAQAGELDEQAAPSYARGCWLSRGIFWKRLRHIWRRLERLDAGGAVMDFGCGTGVLLPLLADRFDTVIAVEPEMHHTETFLDAWGAGLRDKVHLAGQLEQCGREPASLEAILALDVLEHVQDLEGILDALLRLLKPGGILLITGPTENFLYRLGRRIVGFSGHYHCRDVYDIRSALRNRTSVRTTRRIPHLVPLFLCLEARPVAEPVPETT